jgi:hypothetical protein
MLKEYRLELAVITALCCAYNLYAANSLLAVICGVAAVGNYFLYKEGK